MSVAMAQRYPANYWSIVNRSTFPLIIFFEIMSVNLIDYSVYRLITHKLVLLFTEWALHTRSISAVNRDSLEVKTETVTTSIPTLLNNLLVQRGVEYESKSWLIVSGVYYPDVVLGIDSERSEECIDFIMIITSRNNAPISNYGGGFRCKSEYPWCIIEVKS
ncbi:Uncharacterized protein FWK35_00001301 [Aphis craccivora]|uniref:Uncharacterized protein n=1 Tax=Aphis craccivora TaxID=307492 RepID=A0A6G0ZIP1_APHCR|nr:Uncharacterized protein FWK35_00001301 [Aphis craccivora]